MRRDVRASLTKISKSKRHKEGAAHERKDGLVSICIPNFNKGSYLKEALNSAMGQTYPNIELIIVDDGSTDDSRVVIDEFIKRRGNTKRIVYMALPVRCGTAWAQNMTYYLSKGEYIANWDSDDLCHPERIQRQVEYLESEQKDLCGTNFTIFRSDPDNPTVADGGNWLRYDPEQIEDSYLLRGVHCICFGSLMFRYPVLERSAGLRKEYIGTEDYDFIDRAIANGFKPGNLRQALYYYRTSATQRSTLFHSSSV